MREKNVVVVKVVVRGVRNFIDRFFFKCPISMISRSTNGLFSLQQTGVS